MASLARSAAGLARVVSPRGARSLAVSAVARKDLVQDLYMRELKAYKPTPQAKDAHVGIVKEYHAPSTPPPQALPSDLAAELSKYDAAEPDLADAPIVTTSTHDAPEAADADAFLEMLEEDVHEAHH